MSVPRPGSVVQGWTERIVAAPVAPAGATTPVARDDGTATVHAE
jgi:hypothetical protein